MNKDIHEILDNTDNSRIFLSSDWHLFKNRFKKEKNLINTANIISWCKKNIKDNDVFMYLGDLSYRYSDEEALKETQNIFKSLPGIKVLILGNHDIMCGQDFYGDCGFNFVFEELTHNNIIFTHRPKLMTSYPDNFINIHGHTHNVEKYNTMDGSRNANVYPLYFNNKPVTLKYMLDNFDKLTSTHEWNPNNGMFGESAYDIYKNNIYHIPARGANRFYPYCKNMQFEIINKLCYICDAFIFDFGNVLVGDNTKELYYKSDIPDEYVEEIYSLVGKLLYSENKELATASVEEIRQYMIDNLPEQYVQYVDTILNLIPDGLYIYRDRLKVLSYLKYRGKKVYYLSNWDKWNFDLEIDTFTELFEYFDGGLMSFETGYYKPEKEIYEMLLDKYDINPRTAVFFDDKTENLDAAKALGINCIHVKQDDVKSVREFVNMTNTIIKDINEWAMNSCNPIIGITKPHIVQICKDDCLLSPVKYGLSTDLLSDKYLVVNEESKLEAVDKDKLLEYNINVYKINKRVDLSKISEAYSKQSIVDESFIYTSITNKPLLTNDQIEYDDLFSKVDFDEFTEINNTALATLQSNILEHFNYDITVDSNYKNLAIETVQCPDGYYLKNSYNGKRSRCVNELTDINDAIINSVYR